MKRTEACKMNCSKHQRPVTSSRALVACAKDTQRGKGKRGGLRVIYFWWESQSQFWLFTLYDKSEMDDLSPKDRAALKTMLKQELESRK